MPLLVFDCKGIAATRRERIEAAVEAGGKHVKEPYEGWIAADPFRRGVRLIITGLRADGTGWSIGGNEITAMAGKYPECVGIHRTPWIGGVTNQRMYVR